MASTDELTRAKYKSALALVGFLFISYAVAVISSTFSPGVWYAGLVKPSWNPPSWIFGPVWTLLYGMIAVAAWRVWRVKDSQLALGMWALHLVPNMLWSYFFFSAHRMDYALVDITFLLVGIVATMGLFAQRDRIAALLLVPYLAWVSFATLLNWTLLRLNWQV
jgi:translocator protein